VIPSDRIPVPITIAVFGLAALIYTGMGFMPGRVLVPLDQMADAGAWKPDPRVRVSVSNRLLSDAGVLDLGRGVQFDWSPDGHRIAFSGSPTSALDGEPSYKGLAIVSITGGKLTFPAFRGAAEPSWAPRGGRIAFSRDHNLYSARPDGTKLRLLKHGNDWFEPSWSPDGRRIVYRQGGVYVLDVSRRRVVRIRQSGWPAVWSPNGARLAWDRFYQGTDYIFVGRADGRGTPRPLTWGRVADWR